MTEQNDEMGIASELYVRAHELDWPDDLYGINKFYPEVTADPEELKGNPSAGGDLILRLRPGDSPQLLSRWNNATEQWEDEIDVPSDGTRADETSEEETAKADLRVAEAINRLDPSKHPETRPMLAGAGVGALPGKRLRQPTDDNVDLDLCLGMLDMAERHGIETVRDILTIAKREPDSLPAGVVGLAGAPRPDVLNVKSAEEIDEELEELAQDLYGVVPDELNGGEKDDLVAEFVAQVTGEAKEDVMEAIGRARATAASWEEAQ